MTHPNPELHRLMNICPMSHRAAAALMCRDDRIMRRWLGGQYPVDVAEAEWLTGLCDWLDANPPPRAEPGGVLRFRD